MPLEKKELYIPRYKLLFHEGDTEYIYRSENLFVFLLLFGGNVKKCPSPNSLYREEFILYLYQHGIQKCFIKTLMGNNRVCLYRYYIAN